MPDLAPSPAPLPAADAPPSAHSPEQPGAASPPTPGRAAPFQTFEAALAAPFEITFHDVRGGIQIEYLTGEQVISRLLEVLGACGWSFRILEHGVNSEADEVWVLGELQLLLDPDDRVVRQQFGSAKIKRSRSTGAPLEIGYDLKAAARSDLIVGGPNLAAQAIKAGLVDECHLFIWPVVLGGAKPALPTDTRAELELLDERRFGNGVVHLRYRPL